jgi:hypothetical protein
MAMKLSMEHVSLFRMHEDNQPPSTHIDGVITDYGTLDVEDASSVYTWVRIQKHPCVCVCVCFGGEGK